MEIYKAIDMSTALHHVRKHLPTLDVTDIPVGDMIVTKDGVVTRKSRTGITLTTKDGENYVVTIYADYVTDREKIESYIYSIVNEVDVTLVFDTSAKGRFLRIGGERYDCNDCETVVAHYAPRRSITGTDVRWRHLTDAYINYGISGRVPEIAFDVAEHLSMGKDVQFIAYIASEYARKCTHVPQSFEEFNASLWAHPDVVVRWIDTHCDVDKVSWARHMAYAVAYRDTALGIDNFLE